MTIARESNRSTAIRHWGKAAPEWVLALADACDTPAATQKTVAKRLGVSDSLVNQVLHHVYGANGKPGRLDRIEQLVRGALMNKTVLCPVLAEITSKRCMDEQARRHIGTNENRRELRRACPRCPNRLDKEPGGSLP